MGRGSITHRQSSLTVTVARIVARRPPARVSVRPVRRRNRPRGALR
jgi:hypothetical protein